MKKYDQIKRNNKRKWLYHEYYIGGPRLWWDCWIDTDPCFNNLNWFRQIRTFTERRANCLSADEKDYGVRIRGRRSTKALPEPWDDYGVSAWYAKESWKHNSKRASQWKYE